MITFPLSSGRKGRALHIGNGDAIPQCTSCDLAFIKRQIILLQQKQRRRLGEGSVTLLNVGGKMPIWHSEWVLLSLMILDIRIHLTQRTGFREH